jgi:hypothetical protein
MDLVAKAKLFQSLHSRQCCKTEFALTYLRRAALGREKGSREPHSRGRISFRQGRDRSRPACAARNV